jgi:hypothetical protein
MDERQNPELCVPRETPGIGPDNVVRPEFHPSLAMNIRAQVPALCHPHDADRVLVLGENMPDVAVYGVRQTAQVATRFHVPCAAAMLPTL